MGLMEHHSFEMVVLMVHRSFVMGQKELRMMMTVQMIQNRLMIHRIHHLLKEHRMMMMGLKLMEHHMKKKVEHEEHHKMKMGLLVHHS